MLQVRSSIICCPLNSTYHLHSSQQNKNCLDLQTCTVERSGETGVCMPFSDCKELVEEYQKFKILPTVCNRQNRTICCPMVVFATWGLVSVIKRIFLWFSFTYFVFFLSFYCFLCVVKNIYKLYRKMHSLMHKRRRRSI